MQQNDFVTALRLVKIGGAHEHRNTLFLESLDDLPEFAAGDGIDAHRRLVQEEQLRGTQQGASDAELLFHAAGQRSGAPGTKGAECGEFEQFPLAGSSRHRR